MISVFSVPVYVYDVPQRCGVQVAADYVLVKYVDDDVLIVRRGLGVPAEVVSGRADVIVGIDEQGRIVNVEIDFADYYYIGREEARKVLKKARW
jgi:hypothetical protein